MQKKIAGITAVANQNYHLIKDAGIEWLRTWFAFPYKDRIGGEYSKEFIKCLGNARKLSEMGFKHLGTTVGPGSYRYDENAKATIWKSGLPEWAGSYEDDEYYEVLEAACAEMAAKTADFVYLWQIANEPDIDIFRGPLSDEQIVRFLLTAARGVKKGNPDARPGINIGFITEYSEWLMKQIYCIPDSPFEYIGIDGYFGSWQPGGPEDWKWYIDKVYEITSKPVIINEWGYSSLQSSPKTDDPHNKKYYNQDVCRNKAWNIVWKKEHSPEEQAEYIWECMKIFSQHPHVIGQFFFRWTDTPACWQCGQPDCPAECAWGIVDVNGNPKPGYYALKDAINKYFK